MTETVTIDTNLLREYWDDRRFRHVVEQLLTLQAAGEIDLAIAKTVRADILDGRPPDQRRTSFGDRPSLTLVSDSR